MDSLYCSLCRMYFYTVVDYESHQLSTEHLQMLVAQYGSEEAAAVEQDAGGGDDQNNELELVQSDFIFVSSSNLPSGQVFGTYQASIRQVIPMDQSYVVLLDAVPPNLWNKILASFNQFAASFPLFVQSGAAGRPPTDKRLMDFVLIVDLDPATDAFQFSESVSSSRDHPEISPDDVFLVPSDDGTDSTAFVRINPSLNRRFVLQCIRNNYILPSYRKVSVFELWAPQQEDADQMASQTKAKAPAPRDAGTSVRPPATVKEPPSSSFDPSDLSNLNKNAHGLLASLSKASRAAVQKVDEAPQAPQYKVDNVNPYFLVRQVSPRSRSPTHADRRQERRRSSSGGGEFNDRRPSEGSRSPASHRSRSPHGARRRSRRSGTGDRQRRTSGHDDGRHRKQSADADGRRRREASDEAPGERRRRSRSRHRDRVDSPRRMKRRRGSQDGAAELDSMEPWTIKGGQQPYIRISGFKVTDDSFTLVKDVAERLSNIQSAYALVPSKSVSQKAVICTFDTDAMPSVNQVREKLADLGGGLFVQDYSPETFHQFRSNKPFSFYFAPLPKEKATDPIFIVVWNIPSDVSANRLIYKARRAFPTARSFCCPRYSSGRMKNCGYLVARFNSHADCEAVYEKLEHSDAEYLRAVFYRGNVLFTYASMEETCLIPPFSFPCHNFMIWVMDAEKESNSVLDCLPDRPYIPFACDCHPDAMPIAPHATSLPSVAAHIVRQLATDGPEEVARSLPELLKLEDSQSLKAGGGGGGGGGADGEETSAESHRVPPIELNKINLQDMNAYWCLLYGPDHFYSVRGFPLAMESLDIERLMKDACPQALNIYVQVYPQPLPQVLTKQVVFRVPPSFGYNPKQLKSELMRRLRESGIGECKLHANEWGYRAWSRFKSLRPFMLPFSPVPLSYRKPHFIIVWNINSGLGKHVFIRNFLNKYPQIRSAHSPNLQPGQSCRNCEYCLLRFNTPEQCVQTLASLQLLTESEKLSLCPNSDIRFGLCRMEETCYVPPFLFPCHNFFWWYGRFSDGQAAKGDKLCVETWDKTFTCSCHPYCEPYTPSGPHLVKFSQMVRDAVRHSSVEAVKECLVQYIEASNDTSY